ncbi:MAG: redoxin domain-containing protein [Acidobacteriota bacterium]
MSRRSRISPALSAAVAVMTLAAGWACADASAATVGEPAPGFTLPDLEGAEHSLSEYRGQVVVLEWINPNCPFSLRHARERTMIELADRDVVFLAINSTNPDSRDFLTPSEHDAYNREHGIDYPVLYDRSGDVGRAYDAKTTPHMYVIDEEGTLVYQGAIDDDPPGRQSADERANYVMAALESHDAGRMPEPASTKPYGCTVKY